MTATRGAAFGISFLGTLLASALAGPSENATLIATINPGPLEIVPPSVEGPFSPTGDPVTVSNADQVDALSFKISGIAVNDFNGDGRGWKIVAAPAALTSGSSTIPVGTVTGFQNPSDSANTTIVDPSTSVFTLGAGVAGFTIDYTVAYTIPAFAAAGTYQGSIAFSVIAE